MHFHRMVQYYLIIQSKKYSSRHKSVDYKYTYSTSPTFFSLTAIYYLPGVLRMLSLKMAAEAGTLTYLSSRNLGTLLVAISDNTSRFDSELFAWKSRPSMMGNHSLYVTAWCSAIAIFLASWYNRSSSQWGLRRASSRARRLCSLSCRIWKTVNWGFWFTRTSPVNRYVLHAFILSCYLFSVFRLLQTNTIAVAC